MGAVDCEQRCPCAVSPHSSYWRLLAARQPRHRRRSRKPPSPSCRLEEVIAFNRTHGARELSFFGQELFEQAARKSGLDDPAYRELLETCRRLTGAVPARTEGPMSRVAVRPLAGEQERNGQGGVRALLPISGSTSGIFVELSGCCPRSTIAAHALGVANPDPSSACVNSGFCPPGEADVGAGAHNVTFRRVGRGMGGGFTCAATNGLTWWSSAGRSLISCSQKGES